jgi:hypothetical protein
MGKNQFIFTAAATVVKAVFTCQNEANPLMPGSRPDSQSIDEFSKNRGPYWF